MEELELYDSSVFDRLSASHSSTWLEGLIADLRIRDMVIPLRGSSGVPDETKIPPRLTLTVAKHPITGWLEGGCLN